ncbi:MAG: DUF58 domain-containing protein [Abditibacteriales bacterium]|nr:DUF58 domain-containing protein [Abditibacteriales bacterium]MDW8367118.1 DUF58 domain-containing protein [Abditibacteriales bacterium]
MSRFYQRFNEKCLEFFSNKVHVALLFAFLFTYIVASVIGTPLLWFISATIVSVVVVELALSRAALRPIKCEREVAPVGTEGGTARWVTRVTNRGRFPRLFIIVSDTLPEWVQPIGAPAQQLVQLIWGGQTVELQTTLALRKRGKYHLGPLMLRAADPLGLFNSSATQAADAELTVFPRRLKVEGLGFAGGGEWGTQHLQRAAIASDALEFHGVRDYRPGDPLRHIHWKATAHLGEFRVIEFEETLSTDMTILLDLQEGSDVGEGKETTLEYGIVIAASLAEYLIHRGNTVQLVLHNGEGVQAVSAHSDKTFYALLDLLAGAEARSPLDVCALVEVAAPWMRNENSVIIISAASPERLGVAAKALRERYRARVGCFVLDRASFGDANPPSRDATSYDALRSIGAAVRVVHRGDDLRKVLEAG